MVMIIDLVHGVGHSPVSQILLQIYGAEINAIIDNHLPIEMPACEPTKLTLVWEMAPIRI